MPTAPAQKTSLREKISRVKPFRCKNVIVVIEHPDNLFNVGVVVRNVNALGAEKVYIITDKVQIPDDWTDMRSSKDLNKLSASAVKWTFVKIFPSTEACSAHLEKKGFVSLVTSPHTKGRVNQLVHEADYTKYKKLALWFGNERNGLSTSAIEQSELCINIPMFGIIESLNLGTATGIVLYEVGKQRRAFQLRLHEKSMAMKRAEAIQDAHPQ